MKSPRRKSKTLLLVDDDNAIRHLCRDALESQGYTVLEASEGLEAVFVCLQHHRTIHLLVTDLLMPKMGGAELAQTFAVLRPGAAVLFMSGDTNPLTPGVDFIRKPFLPAAFVGKVREMLASARREPESPKRPPLGTPG